MKLIGSSLFCFRSSLSSINTIGNPFSLFFYSSISSFDDINCVKDARFTVNQMIRTRPKLTVIDYTKLLGTVVKMKNYSYALSLFREMRILGAPLDIYTMSIAINCYCSLKKSNMGFAVLGCLFKSGHVPNVVTYNTLIKGLFGEDRGKEAVELFKRLMREKLCEPCEFTFGILLNGLCKHGHTLKALEWLRVFEKREISKPNIQSYTTIVDCLCKDSMVDKAFQLFQDIPSKGLQPNTVTYSSMIHVR